MDFSDEPRGVEGWLMFFLVTLGVLTPVGLLVSTMISWNEAAYAYRRFPGLMSVDIGTSIAVVAAAWFACYRLTAVFNWTSVRITVGVLWFSALMFVAVQPWLVSQLSGVPLNDIFGALGAGTFRPLGYATIWTLYLLNSKRVRNTYGEGQAIEAEPAEAV